jgi:lipid II:glycine glycyltransferase (peptidoglycan interpeptide bridge formation enzyme)
LWSKNDAEWNQTLLTFSDYSIFHAFEWGEFKKNRNWKPLRYHFLDKNGKIIGLALLFVKKLPLGLTFIWSPGGPVFSFPNSNVDLVQILEVLVKTIQKEFPRSVIRFNSHLKHNPLVTYNFNRILLRPIFKINSGYTIHIDLEQSMEDIKRKMTSKHRYYTKKAINSNIEWKTGNDDKLIDDFLIIHGEMVKDKKISFIGTDHLAIQQMRKSFGKQLFILVGYWNEVPITSCLLLLFGKKAVYYIASTNKLGRDISAAYAMFERLIEELHKNGFSHFDFGGIDPANPMAAGVNHYKTGFGGQIIEYVGEWEVATSEIIRWIINIAIHSKGGRV